MITEFTKFDFIFPAKNKVETSSLGDLVRDDNQRRSLKSHVRYGLDGNSF